MFDAKIGTGWVGIFTLLAASRAVDANVALTPGIAYSAGSAVNFNVGAGATIDIPITISEYGATKEITAGGGLDAAGFLVTHQLPGPNDDSIISNAGVALALFPDVLSATYDDNTATVTMDIFPKESLAGNPALVSQGLISLGGVTIQAGSLMGQVSTYTIQDVPGSYTFLTDNFDQLDGLLSPAIYKFTVTATPEPASSALLTIGAGLSLLRRRSQLHQ